MKSTSKLLSAIALGAAMAQPIHAQTAAAKPAQVMDVEGMSKLVKVTAVVQAVDQKRRTASSR
ncbi:MAG TPA: hypothetical protein DIT03_06260 [Candidatus Accumulibacter sp.]|nr:hypothetical protein [Accumulibacter sp.]